MSRALAFNIAAVVTGAFILAFPFLPGTGSGDKVYAARPFLIFGASLLLLGVFGLLRSHISRARMIGITLLAVSALVLAVSFNVFLDRMTWNDYDPRGVMYAAILAAIGVVCFFVKPDPARQRR